MTSLISLTRLVEKSYLNYLHIISLKLAGNNYRTVLVIATFLRYPISATLLVSNRQFCIVTAPRWSGHNVRVRWSRREHRLPELGPLPHGPQSPRTFPSGGTASTGAYVPTSRRHPSQWYTGMILKGKSIDTAEINTVWIPSVLSPPIYFKIKVPQDQKWQKVNNTTVPYFFEVRYCNQLFYTILCTSSFYICRHRYKFVIMLKHSPR